MAPTVRCTDLPLVALALSFSSTVVAIKVLEEQNATRSRAAASLASFSEFALIVVVAASSAGALAPEWLVMVSTAVALSFVVAAVMGAAVDGLRRADAAVRASGPGPGSQLKSRSPVRERLSS